MRDFQMSLFASICYKKDEKKKNIENPIPNMREIEKESEKNNRGRSRKSRWCAQHEQATLLSISGDDKSYPAAVSASDSGFPAGNPNMVMALAGNKAND
ncbi:hypothetical protein LXL04_006559 [Taraxacum kok-saghyz]